MSMNHDVRPPDGRSMNHFDIVQRIADASPPDGRSTQGLLDFLLRVLAALPPDEQAGLLAKPTGENIAFYPPADTNVSISRLCYPDGQLYKILTDAGVGGTNKPAWNLDDKVDPKRYVAVSVNPLPGPQPEPPLPPIGPNPDLCRFVPEVLAEVLNRQILLEQAVEQFARQIAQNEATIANLLAQLHERPWPIYKTSILGRPIVLRPESR